MSVITELTVYIIKLVENVILSLGYSGVFILMLLEGMLLPIPSEVVMTFSGYLAYYGLMGGFNSIINVILLLIIGSVGDLVGALIAYAIGKYGGDPFILKYGKYLMLKKDTVDRTKAWFAAYGELSVFTTRFLPVFRTFISIPAGMALMSLKKFSFFTLLGDLIYDAILIYIGIVLGSRWEVILKYFDQFSYVAVIIFIAIVIYVYLKLRSRNIKTLKNGKTNK
ncbi:MULTISPECIES: DedA family protein [Acidiplasma]|uniref:Alkaline phosphatase n=2 Tax=Acidiplasma cupricumulans TaxID=312540 RepID=A0A0Q0WDY7_9ARCH|nr:MULTISPECIES: DedA family protein [Acidiplasma]KJE48751.1 alkaline phosphatase [Acidiplasma sp. MBA-1]KQB33483.1 alkaline phosphatase [Acidiplasma cupricumulans]WMT55573.1 MAG: DedA family protein [Acidiplasma sp.]